MLNFKKKWKYWISVSYKRYEYHFCQLTVAKEIGQIANCVPEIQSFNLKYSSRDFYSLTSLRCTFFNHTELDGSKSVQFVYCYICMFTVWCYASFYALHFWVLKEKHCTPLDQETVIQPSLGIHSNQIQS